MFRKIIVAVLLSTAGLATLASSADAFEPGPARTEARARVLRHQARRERKRIARQRHQARKHLRAEHRHQRHLRRIEHQRVR